MKHNCIFVRYRIIFHGHIVRFCLASAVVRESANFSQNATRYKMVPASGGNPRAAGTFCPQAANTIVENWTPQNATPLSFFRDSFD